MRWSAFAGALLLAAACERVEAPEPEPDADLVAARSVAQLSADEVDRLRALGYATATVDLADPAESGVEVIDRAALAPGYSLYTAVNDCAAHLIDLDGRVVHSWSRQPCGEWMHADLLPNGDLLVPGVDVFRDSETTRQVRFLLRLDWAGNVVFKTALPFHHDAEQRPDGGLITLAESQRMDHPYDVDAFVSDNSIVRLSARGELEDEISLYDLLRESPDFEIEAVRKKPQRHKAFQYKHKIDLFHANSVELIRDSPFVDRDPLYTPGHVLISIRHARRHRCRQARADLVVGTRRGLGPS